MDLWIRTQDRTTLIKTDRLDIDYSSGLYSIKSDGFGTLLANYKSEERVLEVLDEIQKILNFEYTFLQDISSYVYQMPID